MGQHLIAPGVLVLLAECGPVYRRRLVNRLTAAEEQERREQERRRVRDQQEAERRRRQEQQDEDCRRAQEQEDQDRLRKQRQEDGERQRRQDQEDQERAAELEEKREAARAARSLEARRLDLEGKRLTITVPAVHGGGAVMTAHRHDGVTAPTAPAPQPRPAAPAPTAPVRVPAAPAHRAEVPARQAPAPSPALARTESPASVAAVQASLGRVSARIEECQEDKPPTATATPADSQIWERPTPQPAPARPTRDWDLPGLPADCAPGRKPELLTDAQVTARIDYGLTQEWTQRRIGEFAGRSDRHTSPHSLYVRRSMAWAALIRPMWLKACGKFPRASPVAEEISSASSPTSLAWAIALRKTS